MESDNSSVATYILNRVIAGNNSPLVEAADEASSDGPPPFAAGMLDANDISNMGPPSECDNEEWALDEGSAIGPS